MQNTAFIEELKQLIDEKHLLKHPFYRMWEEGSLPIEVMRKYAEQYYHLESNFPLFLSIMHTRCSDKFDVRQEIVENLHDEEYGDENHRELWLRYAESIGAKREDAINSQIDEETETSVNTFKNLSAHHFLAAAGALAAYESQMPPVSDSKIKGLKEHYGITDPRGLKFFEVHGVLDIEHADSWWRIIDKYADSEEIKDMVRDSVIKGRDALWGFLDGICKNYMPPQFKNKIAALYKEAEAIA